MRYAYSTVPTDRSPRLDPPERKLIMNAKAVDPKKARTQNAILANMRGKEKRYAELLVERGWAVITPYEDNLDDLKQSLEWEKRAVEMLINRGWKITPADED